MPAGSPRWQTARPRNPRRGRVWIRDGEIVDGDERHEAGRPGSAQAPEVDVGDAFVLARLHRHAQPSGLQRACRCGASPAGPSRGCTTSTGPTPTPTPNRSPNRRGSTPRRVRKRCSATCRSGRWPAARPACRAGRPRTAATRRWSATSTAEDAGTGKRRSHLHLGGDQDRRRAGHRGAPDGRRRPGSSTTAPKGSADRGCCATTPTSSAPKGSCRRSSGSTAAPSTPANWAKWAAADAGGVVWSPLSNLVLYAQTTLIDDVRARGVRVCLGSDWGPSGTKNLLGEMKVARIAADHFGYTLTDAEIVEMVTSNPGTLLERCWDRPIGRLVKGGVRRRHGRPRPRPRQPVEADRRRDRARRRARRHRRRPPLRRRQADDRRRRAPPTFTMTVGGRRRRVALPDPADTAAAWSWTAIMDTLEAVQRDPQTAIATAHARAASGPRFADDAELELFLDMPDTRRSGRAGPPKNPATVRIPPDPVDRTRHRVLRPARQLARSRAACSLRCGSGSGYDAPCPPQAVEARRGQPLSRGPAATRDGDLEARRAVGHPTPRPDRALDDDVHRRLRPLHAEARRSTGSTRSAPCRRCDDRSPTWTRRGSSASSPC